MEPLREFDGQLALVTGAAGAGIGQAIARRLVAGGADVIVSDIHEARTEKVTEAITADFPDATVHGRVLDVGDRDAIDATVAAITAELGPVTILVNNAAVNVMRPIYEFDPDDWDWVLRVNLTGPWQLCRRIMPIMRDAGGGAIVNISTAAPDEGGFGLEAPYAVSKGGLNVLTRSCAHEGAPHGIRSNAVSMGLVRGTRFLEQHPETLDLPGALPPGGELPTADDIAEAVAFLASERARSVTGEILHVSAGTYMRP